MRLFLVISLCFISLASLSQDGTFIKPIKQQAPLYKYYVYTEVVPLLFGNKGFNLNFEVNLKHKKNHADYFRVWLGLNKDEDWIQNYPSLQGKYSYTCMLFYCFIERRKQINFEVAPGIGCRIGDPITRDYNQSGYYGVKFAFAVICDFGIRYTFKKVPINLRVSYLPFYDLNINKLYPLFGSFSIGYSFKEIKNETSKFNPDNHSSFE